MYKILPSKCLTWRAKNLYSKTQTREYSARTHIRTRKKMLCRRRFWIGIEIFRMKDVSEWHLSTFRHRTGQVWFVIICLISLFDYIRLPLQEIKQDVETPVCMNEILSPMSIDKSLIENDANVSIITVDDQATSVASPSTSTKRFAVRDNLEKFFECEEYRGDILVCVKCFFYRFFEFFLEIGRR